MTTVHRLCGQGGQSVDEGSASVWTARQTRRLDLTAGAERPSSVCAPGRRYRCRWGSMRAPRGRPSTHGPTCEVVATRATERATRCGSGAALLSERGRSRSVGGASAACPCNRVSWADRRAMHAGLLSGWSGAAQVDPRHCSTWNVGASDLWFLSRYARQDGSETPKSVILGRIPPFHVERSRSEHR